MPGTQDADECVRADESMRRCLAVAKDLYAAQQQSTRLMQMYRELLAKLPARVWTSSGCLTVVDADRVVWQLRWDGGFPTVERVATVDVLDEPEADADTPAMWREAQEL